MSNAWAMRPLPMASLTWSGTSAGGTAPANMANDYLGVVWIASNTSGAFTLTIDLGAASWIDTAVFLGCSGISAGLDTNSWQAADNSAISVGVVTLATDTPFLAGSTYPSHGRAVSLFQAAAAVQKRYVRFTFNGSAGLGVGRLAIGQRLQLERNFAFGAGYGLRDFGSVDFSSRAAMLRRRAAKLRTVGLTFPWVRKDEVEQKVRPLIELCGSQEPIVLCTDPAADADRQNRIFFGPMTSELGVVQRSTAGWEWRNQLIDLVPIPKAS